MTSHRGIKSFEGRSRTWKHSSVIALMREHPDFADPEDVIRAIAKDKADYAQRHGWSGPPFDPEVLASLLGIKVTSAPLGHGRDAMIHALDDGTLEIRTTPGAAPTRRNYSINHELTHTFFPDCYETVRFRSNNPQRADPDKELEELCDLGAAELLLPEGSFREDLARIGVGLTSIETLRERYAASREAVSIRMVNLADEACAVAFLTHRLKPTEERARRTGTTPTLKFRVDFMAVSRTFAGLRLPKHKSIPDGSFIYDLLKPRSWWSTSWSGSRTETWETGKNSRITCRIEATSIPGSDPNEKRALVLLFPS